MYRFCKILLMLAGMLSSSVFATDEAGVLPFERGDVSRLGNRVLVLEFTDAQCPYCHQLEREVLQPLLSSGELRHKMQLRSIDTYTTSAAYSFADKIARSGKELSQIYGVRYTPTLVFVDNTGRQLARPIHGINNLEFYGFYLQQKVEEAYAKLQQQQINLNQGNL